MNEWHRHKDERPGAFMSALAILFWLGITLLVIATSAVLMGY